MSIKLDDIIFSAIVDNNIEACEFLLKHRKSVNYRDELLWTPLHYAAENGHTEICELLLRYGADVNANGKDDKTSLHCAAYRGDIAMCRWLIDHGADVNVVDCDGFTSLHYAAGSGYVATCNMLIVHGADVNAVSKKGYTALRKLIMENGNDCIDVCKLLLEHGADMDIKDLDGKTAMIAAKDAGYTDVYNLLLNHKNNKDKEVTMYRHIATNSSDLDKLMNKLSLEGWKLEITTDRQIFFSKKMKLAEAEKYLDELYD